MEANSRPLLRIFEPTVCYQIPLFQRPYVWKQEENWKPLWEDFERLLGLALTGERLCPHFLGAVVLEEWPEAAVIWRKETKLMDRRGGDAHGDGAVFLSAV
ncbi:hypothetical protein AO741_06665 [Pseudomonas sp. TTU2014-105ASC]|nr:hypothetical protein AO741_06665 [Pseudomonas sp. TTU2014-105ASC]